LKRFDLKTANYAGNNGAFFMRDDGPRQSPTPFFQTSYRISAPLLPDEQRRFVFSVHIALAICFTNNRKSNL